MFPVFKWLVFRSLYNQMKGKPKEDGDLLLNTESGDTTNDPKQCADHFAKAFYTKVVRLSKVSNMYALVDS